MTTFPIHLTYEQAVADLTAIVEEFGADHKYQQVSDGDGCTYFRHPRPASATADLPVDAEADCIIGQLLARHGVTLKDLGTWNWGCGVMALRGKGFLDFDEKTGCLLEGVQARQDAGWAWGEALTEAKRSAEENYP